ncbi:EXPORTIN 1B [Spatholobus suberectus]|nr:EXPORTIN 1B [Spatholobus suberectus]
MSGEAKEGEVSGGVKEGDEWQSKRKEVVASPVEKLLKVFVAGGRTLLSLGFYHSHSMAAEKLRDLSQPIDVSLLDATVAAFYGTGSKEEVTVSFSLSSLPNTAHLDLGFNYSIELNGFPRFG